jgi:hypothetical protein
VRKRKTIPIHMVLSVSFQVYAQDITQAAGIIMSSVLSRRHSSILKNTASASVQSTSGAALLCCAP